jgi:hypothetical protein
MNFILHHILDIPIRPMAHNNYEYELKRLMEQERRAKAAQV